MPRFYLGKARHNQNWKLSLTALKTAQFHASDSDYRPRSKNSSAFRREFLARSQLCLLGGENGFFLLLFNRVAGIV
jgi:hypothetical protein